MKIFLTGGMGFIGQSTLRRCMQAGHQVRCLVRKQRDFEDLQAKGIDTVLGDISDKRILLKGMEGHDQVLNLAAAYHFWLPDKRIYRDVNVTGTRNVMEAALEASVSKVIHVSSVVVYGKPDDCPFHEDSAPGPFRFSEYAQTKYEGDQIAWDLHREKGLPLVVIYPGAVLGPDDPKPTGEYIQNILSRRLPATICEDIIFPWVHVEDVAEAIVRAAEKKNNLGEKYIIARHNMTFGEINRIIGEISGVPLPRLHLPVPLAMLTARVMTCLSTLTKKPPMWGMAVDQVRLMREGAAVDGSKAERELGLQYTSIRKALEEAIQSYRSA